MKRWNVSRAFLTTCLLAVSNVLLAPREHVREAVATALIGIAAAVSGGARKKEERP